MEVTGEHRFGAGRAAVWETLMSPDALRDSIPGCVAFEATGPDSYSVKVKMALSAITGVYDGTVAVADSHAMESYRLLVEGSGKAGRVQASAAIRLEDDGEGTLLRYTAEVKPQGAIARLGNRLLASAANMMIGQFFKAIEQCVTREAPPSPGQ